MSLFDKEAQRSTGNIDLSKVGSERGATTGSETYFDVEQGSRQDVESATHRKKPVLITLDGRRVSERFILVRERSYIGRDIHADVKIADGEISRRHCVIHWSNMDKSAEEEPRCSVADCNSTNGTFLNNEPIGDKSQVLSDGDLIRVGRTVFGFFLKDERVLELDQLLLSMALHDSLTGLYKREYFFSELHREFDRSKRHNRPLSVALLDLDHFKRVNDEYGHLRGDEALHIFADMLRMSLREGDICGRYGGEEFAVVLPETDLAGALFAVERFRSSLAERDLSLGGGVQLRLTCSCGIATLRNHHRDKMHLLDDADQALYRAKGMGRNCTVKASGPLSEEGTQPKSGQTT